MSVCALAVIQLCLSLVNQQNNFACFAACRLPFHLGFHYAWCVTCAEFVITAPAAIQHIHLALLIAHNILNAKVNEMLFIAQRKQYQQQDMTYEKIAEMQRYGYRWPCEWLLLRCHILYYGDLIEIQFNWIHQNRKFIWAAQIKQVWQRHNKKLWCHFGPFAKRVRVRVGVRVLCGRHFVYLQ